MFLRNGADMDSPLKWHGGKHYLAPKLWEIAKAVPHVHRVEVFGGSLAFTLATEPEGFSEVVNDVDYKLMNFWRVIGSPEQFDEFQRLCNSTPFSESLWRDAHAQNQDIDADDVAGDPVGCAVSFFIHVRQSMAGRRTNFAPLSKRRTRRGMNEQASAWLNTVEGLPEAHARLKRVAVRSREFSDIIPSEDTESTLFYLDPPYVHGTRSTTTEYGDHEMTEEQHEQLLAILSDIKGKFMLSGYRSELYDIAATMRHWRRIDFDLPNNSASGASKERKTECVWCNF